MKPYRLRRGLRFAFLPLLASLPGCQAVGGLTGAIMPLLQLAFYLAAALAPFALAYYLYKRDE